MVKNGFSDQILEYIDKSKKIDSRILEAHPNSFNCLNTFTLGDGYIDEKIDLLNIKNSSKSSKKTTKQRGNDLESLIKKIFRRLDLISSFEVTGRDTALGQIDINLVPINNILFDTWGMRNEYPISIIGECKNYTDEKASRPEIEKSCWRACKGRALSFFIAKDYTADALKEIGYFNHQKGAIFHDFSGVLIVPMTLGMIEVIIDNNCNFSYFVKWSIQNSRNMSIVNYL